MAKMKSTWTIASDKFEKSDLELKPYDMPITKLLIDNSVKDMAEAEDRHFKAMFENHCFACGQHKDEHLGNKCLFGPGLYTEL